MAASNVWILGALLLLCIVKQSDAHNLPAWDPQKWHGPPPIDPFHPEWPNSIAICAMMKDEALPDIEEWLAYHRWIGVDKVFLWEDSESISDALQQQVQPYIDVGFVNLYALNNKEEVYTDMQIKLYNRCGRPDMAGSYSWVIPIDLDEYLIILDNGQASTNPKLKDILSVFKNNAGVVLQAILFGSNGHVKRPEPGGPLQHYSACNSYVGPLFKSIANTYWLAGLAVHMALYRYEDDPKANPVVRANSAPINMVPLDPKDPANASTLAYLAHHRDKSLQYRAHAFTVTNEGHSGRVVPGLKLVLFHYVTRSQEDYFNRKLRITRDSFAAGAKFGTSLFDSPKEGGLEAFNQTWFENLQKQRYTHTDGICVEAANKRYADAAREVGQHVRSKVAVSRRRLV